MNYHQVYHPLCYPTNLIKAQRVMLNRCLRLFFIMKVMILSPALISGATSDAKLMEQKWPFNGIFGRFDESSLQRGFQVYREVCAACHGIRHVSYRDLKGIGYTNDEIKVNCC